MQNTALNVLNAMMNLRQRQLGMRFNRFAGSRSTTNAIPQHYDESHRLIECPKCDREFETQKAVDQVRGQSFVQRPLGDG